MQWTSGTIEHKQIWAEGLFTIGVRVDGVQPFEPGQFLQVGLEQEGGHIHRPYSVASPYGEVLEFFIVVVEDGRLTPQLWTMNAGDRVDVSTKAAGSFTLSHCPDGDTLWLIGTGTGLAPYVAMLRTDQPWQRYDRIIVVHGVRQASDLAYQPEFLEHGKQYGERFRYVALTSRENVTGALPGRITTCLANGSLEAAAECQFTDSSCVLMCGNPAMLNETESMLEERGLRKHKKKEPGQIVVERYW